MTIPLLDLKTQYQNIKKEIQEAINRVLDSAQFILGQEVVRFEQEFARFCGTKYAIGVANGTDALYLALRACSISQGDEVILPPNTFIATAEAITLNGARPVFVDIDIDTYNIDVSKIEKSITKRTKAIIAVHLFGQPADMAPILKLAKQYKLLVIEDCAQAHGAQYRMPNGQWRSVGSMGEMGCYSFYPGKNLGAFGDAGAVVTNNKEIAQKILMLRNHGRLEKYEHKIEGVNSRLDELQAAVLRVKLKYLNKWNKSRQKNARIYNQFLKNTKNIELPKIIDNAKSVYYFYVIRIKNRDNIQAALANKGIITGIHYPVPLHLQPAYKYLGYKKGDFPRAEEAAREILSLPIYPELRIEQFKYIADTIKEIYGQK